MTLENLNTETLMAETIKYKEGEATPDEINRDLDAMVRKANNLPRQEPIDRKFIEWLRDEHPVLHARWMTGPRIQDADSRWTLLLPAAAEDVVAAYGALRAYLQILSEQPDANLETIARVTRLMIAIKPQAVEASQEIARRNNGT